VISRTAGTGARTDNLLTLHFAPTGGLKFPNKTDRQTDKQTRSLFLSLSLVFDIAETKRRQKLPEASAFQLPDIVLSQVIFVLNFDPAIPHFWP
jgi:hypothetical protein